MTTVRLFAGSPSTTSEARSKETTRAESGIVGSAFSTYSSCMIWSAMRPRATRYTDIGTNSFGGRAAVVQRDVVEPDNSSASTASPGRSARHQLRQHDELGKNCSAP